MRIPTHRNPAYGAMSLDLNSVPHIAAQLLAYRTERGLTETAAVRMLVAAALRARAHDTAEQKP